MNYETPQFYRWKDPTLPPQAPALQIKFMEEAFVNPEVTEKTGIQTYDNVLVGYVSPMGNSRSDVAKEIERTLPDGTVIVNRENSAKYAEQIKFYKAGTESAAVGTPLRDLVGMTPAVVMGLRARGIHTVEMLSDMPDNAGNEMMGFWELREKAKKHLDLREKNAPMVRVEAMEIKHKEETDALKQQIEELRALIATDADKPEKRGPGRPPKIAQAA